MSNKGIVCLGMSSSLGYPSRKPLIINTYIIGNKDHSLLVGWVGQTGGCCNYDPSRIFHTCHYNSKLNGQTSITELSKYIYHENKKKRKRSLN